MVWFELISYMILFVNYILPIWWTVYLFLVSFQTFIKNCEITEELMCIVEVKINVCIWVYENFFMKSTMEAYDLFNNHRLYGFYYTLVVIHSTAAIILLISRVKNFVIFAADYMCFSSDSWKRLSGLVPVAGIPLAPSFALSMHQSEISL